MPTGVNGSAVLNSASRMALYAATFVLIFLGVGVMVLAVLDGSTYVWWPVFVPGFGFDVGFGQFGIALI